MGLLVGHQSLVELLEPIDNTRFISASMDGIAIVWNAQSGAIIGRLEGHNHMITSVLVLRANEKEYMSRNSEKDLIVTAAFDGIMFWSLPDPKDTDEVHTPLISVKEGAVCLRKVNDQMFCSGGGTICLWNRKGELLCKYEAKELLNIDMNSMLFMESFELTVVALSTLSNEKSLDVWYIHTPETSAQGSHDKQKYKITYKKAVQTPHTSRIEALHTVSDLLFATMCQSPPVQVILWSTKTVTRIMMIDLPSSPKSPSKAGHSEPHHFKEVSCIVPFMQKFLLVGVENGFQLFNIAERCKGNALKPYLLLDLPQAQGQPVTSACITANGHILATSSSKEGRVKLWSVSKSVSYQSEGNILHDLTLLSRQTKPKLFLVGDIQWHHEQIRHLCSVTQHSFVASGSENDLVLWMDQELERIREEELAQILKERQLL